jgi:putative DNA primase/helicase
MKQKPVTPELARDALAYIPANLPRDDWARIGAAIKSEFPDSVGFDLFDTWSQSSDGYDAKATAQTWKSIKASGGVTIGTLFYEAKARGFDLAEWHREHDEKEPKQTPEQKREADERRTREQAEARQREQARTEAAHARAAAEAAALWGQASDAGESAYLTRKGVQAYALRFTDDGRVLVPLRDEGGELRNLQTINASGEKRFLPGGRKSGLWHWCGTPDGAPVLAVCEGYATAASVHQATGRPAAVGLDAGNLANVAKALRKLHPAALLVLCGDDDRHTEARTGSNPGRLKATAAARAVRGLAVFPAPLPENGSDFNDLATASGLDTVRAVIEGAIEAHQASASAAHAAQADRQGNPGHGPRHAPHDGGNDAHGTGNAYDPFVTDDAGVWHLGRDQEGKPKPPEWVCSRLDVEALTRDQDGGGWGYLLTFGDPLGKVKTWAMPARMLSGDGGEYRAALLGMGLRIAPSPRARNLLTQYVQTRQPAEFASCTDRIGWHGRAFVLPRETIGDGAERIVFQSESQIENTFALKGTPDAWRDRVAALCVGNSRLAFAVACAFAGPLLRPAGVESGGFHYRGDSSSGKTTALKVAASVYGGAGYLQRWRTTDNALEAIAAQHSDCLLILDELSQVDPKTAGECAYMLANEQGKARATRTGTPRARQTWRLLFLSAGELGLSDHMAEGMKRIKVGQETRMADIPADAGAGLGAFENLHGFEGGSAFARHITGQAASVYGAPGRAWLEWLTTNADTLKARIREASATLAAQIEPEGASGQVERVGARFALVGAAGELATAAGLTGWPVGESERAARACFNAWLAARGGIGNGEVVAMLRQVQRVMVNDGEAKFAYWHRAADDHAGKTLLRIGVRCMLDQDGNEVRTNSQTRCQSLATGCPRLWARV